MALDSDKITNTFDAINAVSEDGLNYFNLSSDLQKNDFIAKTAVENNYYIYSFLDDNLKNNDLIKSTYENAKKKIDNVLESEKSSKILPTILYFQLNYLDKKYEKENDDIAFSLGKQISLNKIVRDYCDYINNINVNDLKIKEIKNIITQILSCNTFIKDDLNDQQIKEIDKVLDKLKGAIIDNKLTTIKDLTKKLFTISKKIEELNEEKTIILNELSKLSGGINNNL